MKHSFTSFGRGDIIAPVTTQQLQGGKVVARTRIGFIEQRQNGQVHKSSFQVEAWNEMASRLAAIRQGNTVLFEGKVENYSYKDQAGGEKWAVKVVLFSVADAGPSQMASIGAQTPPPAQNTSAPYNPPPANGPGPGFNGFPGQSAPPANPPPPAQHQQRWPSEPNFDGPNAPF